MLHSRITLFYFVACLLAVAFAIPSNAEAQRGRSGNSNDDKISFTKDVVPIIDAKCGNCHVKSSKGRYNIKSYQALMSSDSVEPDDPDGSFFIEVIENGEMPKGGLKISDDELETLRQWIAEGANFDGDDEKATLSAGGGNARSTRSTGRARSGQSGSSRTQGRRSSRSRSSRSSKPNAIETNKLLAFFDLDGNGKLSLKEIDAASRILRSLDSNGDDRITGNELGDF